MAKRIPTHPGKFIRKVYLEELNITAANLAAALGVNKATMSRLLNEKADLSPQLAFRLSKVLGGSAGSWMNMQANHSLAKIEAEAETETDAWTPEILLKNGILVVREKRAPTRATVPPS